MIALRAVTAAVLLLVVWAIIYRADAVVWRTFVVALVMVGLWEWYRMVAHRGLRPFAWIGVVSSGGVVLSFSPALDVSASGLLSLTVLATATAALLTRDDPRAMADDAGATLFGVLQIGLTLSHLVALREIAGFDGRALLTLLLASVIAADTTAFAIGKLFGRRRLAPAVSPGKSWEGAIAGWVAASLAAVAARFVVWPELPLWHAATVGLLIGLMAVAGDLTISLVKRSTGVKDASSLLPGHGGSLDRSDSLMFSAPTLYYYVIAFL